MNSKSNMQTSGRYASYAYGASIVAMCVSALAIAGWAMNFPVLTSVVPGWPTMKPLTAVCFFLLGISLWFLREPSGAARETESERKLISLALACVVLAISAASLLEYVTGTSFGIDTLIFRSAVTKAGHEHPGRMAAGTAVCFVLLGSSFALMRRKSRSAKWSEYLALLSAALGLISVAAYIYEVPPNYRLGEYSSMSLPTALLFLLLGTCAIYVDNNGKIVREITSPRLGGKVAQRMLPAVVLLPLLVGWVRLMGQRAGWYGTEFGLALYAITQVVILTALVLLCAQWLNRIDGRRVEAQDQALRSASVVDNSDDAIITKTLDGVITSWNAGAQRVFGYSAKEVIGKPMLILFPPERVQEEKDILGKIARGETVAHFESVRLRKGGERIVVSVTISPLRNAHGKIIGASKIARDITQARQNEMKVRQQEARLNAIITSAMDGLITLNSELKITLFNPAAEKIFGVSAAEMMGQPLDRLIPEEYREMHTDQVHHFGQGETSVKRMAGARRIQGQRANGERFPAEASISHAHVNDERIFSVILRDVTAREQAEQKMQQQNHLLDLAPAIVRDMDDRIELWSKGAENLYGFSKDEALGRTPHELLQTEFPQPVSEIRESLLANGMWEGEVTQRARDRSKIVVASRWVVYHDAAGNPSRILEANADITELKRAQRLQTQSQKLESLGTLAGGIAHDFNNILSSINGNASLALSETATNSMAHKHLEEIAKAGTRATNLVKQILSFSRPSEQRREIQPLQDVVEEALKLVRSTIPASIEIVTNFAPDLPLANVDSTQIHQIIVNLATNAAHAIGDKPGTIELKLDSPTLQSDDVTGSLKLNPGRYVRLFLGDNGCGMDQATMARIFDPFFTTKPTGRGTGLGLSVVHGILASYSGAVTVYSELGHGTAFHLYFPAVEGETQIMNQSDETLNRERHERVLYVDDETALVTLGMRKLEKLGYHVSGFTDPTAALEAFRANPAYFDLLITDLSMPQLSGLDLAQKMREKRADLPVVVTSGYVRPEDEEKAQRFGIYNFIAKPISLDELTVTLDRIFLVRGEAVASGTS